MSIIFCFTCMSPAAVQGLRAFDHFTASVDKDRTPASKLLKATIERFDCLDCEMEPPPVKANIKAGTFRSV